jgi:hypothetical protein
MTRANALLVVLRRPRTLRIGVRLDLHLQYEPHRTRLRRTRAGSRADPQSGPSRRRAGCYLTAMYNNSSTLPHGSPPTTPKENVVNSSPRPTLTHNAY